MPKILCDKISPGSDEGTWEIADNEFGIGKKSFSIEYDILADNIDQNEDDIRATPGLPSLWTFLRGCYCKSIEVAEENSHALMWKASCEFDSEVNPDEQENEDPTQAQATWAWSHETEQRNLEKDVKGKPLQTATREKFFVDTPFAIPVLTISRYQLTFDPNVILDYVNHVNKTAFWGAPIGSALMAGITDSQQSINGKNYRKVDYVIKFKIDVETGTLKEDTWQLDLLHHGQFYFLDAGAADKFGEANMKRFTDSENRPITGNLKLNGERLGSADPEVYLSFERFEEVDFNVLNLGPW